MPALRRSIWDVRAGAVLAFAHAGIEITMIRKSGRLARLCVVAPVEVEITLTAANDLRNDLHHVPSMADSPR